ncbi:integrin beta-4-like isoform X2 [Coregonus clupeaformis]|uniref:integrin beta-4-like isoform X2 n=1 Tax=Coregonus clupeaformis TaxID=59861 RepID=UPI001E1C8A57|nr:integrin beta-4-like isoform X2 [Coregonus clupeaformis]
MGRWTLYLLVGVVLAVLTASCYAQKVNHCLAARANTCSACIQSGKGCAYCPDEIFDGPRCDLLENIIDHGCNSAMTAESSMSIERNQRIDVLMKRPQVAPQEMSMTLLPGEEREIEMEVFEPAKGPLDLYILMDFSNSMEDDLDNLKRMGAELAELVGKLSDDYTIGFGKFVDKVVEPQTDMRPSKLAQPWPNSDPPFSFRNVITLTSDLPSFTQKLQKERISGNLDAPEGGFDAILQAAVCGEKIGWRDHATHLLVFSTESAFHYEADGANVLAGIMPRNDEQCHLDPQGKYTEDTRQDYPSVPTLVRLLGKHNIIPIFAVTNHSFTYYQKLHEYFPIAELGLLQEDSANILSILEKAFENIRSKISIRAEDRPKAIEAQVLSYSGSVAQAGTFKVKPGEIGKFKVRVKANEMVGEAHVCKLEQGDKQGKMRVKPTTFSTALNINAEVLCKICDCEKTPFPNAVRCTGHGDLVCGKCQCYDGWLGPFCNCSASASTDAGTSCRGPGVEEPCSGRGDCLCGTCVCYNTDQYEGPLCQFDKSQCQRYGGFLCNDRGRCFMGQCACAEGWEGPACECPMSNQTCLDTKGGVCNGRGVCKCGRCKCQDSGLPMTPTCEANFQAQLGMCEDKRSCVQCQAWKTGEKKGGDKCDQCQFKVTMVDELKENKEVIEACSFRDEDDDCTYHYTVDYPEDQTGKELEVQVLKKKDCPPAGFLWLIPLIMFLMLLLGLLSLCCWKYCACCKSCLALLPCCGRGRTVGFKEDQYTLRQSLLTSDHLDTPLVRTGPPKSTDVVRWKITDNVHRSPNHPLAQVQANPKETIQFPLSLRLNRLFTDSLSQPDARDTEMLRREVDDNLNEVYKQVPGAQRVQNTTFRLQRNAGKRNEHTIVDTVLSAPRSSYPNIVKLTEKNVQSGNFQDLKVVPGYYTVATDREAAGAVEFQEGVEAVDVRVPLFIKEEDEDKKQLLVEAVDVPLGIAEIGKRFVNITVIKEHAKCVMSFLQPAYTYSRQDRVANVPISREIIEDGHAQVSYRTRDLTAKDKKDYVTVDGDLSYGPGETQQTVPVRLLELGEGDGLLKDTQVKQFVMDLSNPRQGAKLGRYPRTTVTITDQPEPSVVMFMKSTQNFSTSDPTYSIPVVRTRNKEAPATVHWRTRNAKRFELSGPLKFGPGETEKNIVIDPRSHPGPIKPETFQLELFDPSTKAVVGERKTTMVTVTDGGVPENVQIQQSMGFINQTATSPGGRLYPPTNVKAKATGPRSIRLNWDPLGRPLGYKVKYWIYGDPEADAQVMDVKTTHAELANLYPYCDYEMKVCGYNGLGDGSYSDMVPCQTLEDVPSEPGRLAFNVISPTVTQVSWAEPAETNGVITAYEVLYTPINDDTKPMGAAKKVKIDNPKKRMLLIENLQLAQTYCYKVRAKNSVGWGPFKEATINLASQPTRPMSIPIIPDIPIVDAEAGDEYDGYLMYSSEVMRSPTGSKRPSVSDEEPTNGRLEQNFLFPGGNNSMSRSAKMSSSSYSQVSPMSTLSSSHRGGAGGSMTTESTTTYLSGQGGNSLSRTQVIGGGTRTENVVMRKRSENRGYYEYDDNIRDSIVIGDLPSGLSGYTDGQSTYGFSPAQSQYAYSMSQAFRARTQSEDVNDALLNLDRVLQESPLAPGVPDTPTRLIFSALGPTALKISWQEPHCDRDVLGYCVLYQLLNGGDVKRINMSSPADNSVVVQDLLPNHSYLFKVKAQSQEGWGQEREGVITIESAVDPNSPLSPMPGSPFTLSTPSAPGPLVFTALSPEALQLSWEKPRKPNGDILGYVVTCEHLHGGGDVRSFQVSGDSAETSLMVPDLIENMPYKFKVQARTTEGFGPEREGIITIESQDGGDMSQLGGLGGMSQLGGLGGMSQLGGLGGMSQLGGLGGMSQLGGLGGMSQLGGLGGMSQLGGLGGMSQLGGLGGMSQLGGLGGMSQYSSQSSTKRDVYQLPTEGSTHTNVTHTMINDPSTHTNVTHTMINDPYHSGDGMIMMGHTETSGMVTRHVTKEVVQRSMQVAGTSSVTKKVERSVYKS